MVTTTQKQPAKLTPRQSAIFQFMVSLCVERGFGPTVREIGSKFGIRSPNGVMCHLKALEKKGMIERDRKCARGIRLGVNAPPRAVLEMAGRVKAGVPVDADEVRSTRDYSDLFGPGMFGLDVDGDSMVNAAIVPGDTVIARKAETANSGDIVIARADGEQTIKRFERRGKQAWLVPANDTMEAWCPVELEIIGVVTGVVRRV